MTFQVQDLTVPLETIFTLSQEAQFVYDLQDQRIIACNALLEELTGYPSIQINNWGPHQQLSLIHPEDQISLAEYIELLHDPYPASLKLQLRVKDSEGHWLPLQANSQIIKRTATDMPGLCLVKVHVAREQPQPKKSPGVGQDQYTSLQNSYDQMLDRNLDLKKTNDLLESFLLSAANDLKSPIGTIKLVLELMDASLSLQDKLDNLHLIRSSVCKLDTILSGLTELIRIQNHIHATSCVHFKEVLERLMPDISEGLSNSEGQLESDFSLCPKMQHIEPFIFIILQKLLHNAIQYAQPGRTPHIKVSTYPQAPYVVLKVEDNGRGMDLSEIGSSLFKPFTRFTTCGEGKGIGLFVVKSLIESKGGSIHLASQPGSGTTVYCYIKDYR